MPLTEIAVKSAKSIARPTKLSDSGGLYLLLRPSGGKWWRWDYRRPGGTRNTLSLGVYPDVSLKAARERRDEARRQLANGVDPGSKRIAEKSAVADSFEAVAREWFEKHRPNWAISHSSKVITRLENDIFPWIGAKPVGKIAAAEVLMCLRRVESRGAMDTAHRAHQNCGQVFRYAVATGRAERDVSTDLRGALAPVKHEHYPSITSPEQIGALLRAIDGYQGSMVVRSALQLAPLLFVRPGELRSAQWAEFSLAQAEWRIPAERMKMRVQHIIPLSKQAVKILRDLEPLTGDCKYLFPSIRTYAKPMSENTLNAGLRRIGYEKSEMTAHGFRSMASTRLNESGKWNSDAIERQLAHGERDASRAAYNYAKHLRERKTMMQWWADYLCDLKAQKSQRAERRPRVGSSKHPSQTREAR